MRVYAKNEYLGYDKNKKPVIDLIRSGTLVMGVYADMDGVGILTIKLYSDSKRCEIIEELVSKDIKNINGYENKIEEFQIKYNIKHFFGNTIASSIVNVNTYVDNSGQIYSGWESIELAPEHLLFLVQSNINHLIPYKFDDLLKEEWETELSSFELDLVRQKIKSYPRTFALACILKGATTEYNGFYTSDTPDKLINDEEIKNRETLYWKQARSQKNL